MKPYQTFLGIGALVFIVGEVVQNGGIVLVSVCLFALAAFLYYW